SMTTTLSLHDALPISLNSSLCRIWSQASAFVSWIRTATLSTDCYFKFPLIELKTSLCLIRETLSSISGLTPIGVRTLQTPSWWRSEEHTSELQSRGNL